MKIKNFTLVALIFFSFINCSKSNEDTTPPYLYTFFIKFVDSNNNNYLNKIDENILKSNFFIAKESEEKIDKLKLAYKNINDERYLEISAASVPDIRLNEIIFNLKSKELFNDDENHKIKTTWQWENEFDNKPKEIYLDNELLTAETTEQSFEYFLIEIFL